MGHTRRLMCLWDGDGIGASEEQEPSLSWIIHATIIAEFLLRPMASSSPFSGTLDSEQRSRHFEPVIRSAQQPIKCFLWVIWENDRDA